MTGQLLKVTTSPYQAVRFTQNARLVASSSADVERRKAIARAKAFHSRYSPGNGNVDVNFVNKINHTFTVNPSPSSTAPSPDGAAGMMPKASPNVSSGGTNFISAPSVPASSQLHDSSAAALSEPSAKNTSVPNIQTADAVSTEASSVYTVDRGAFEFRVAKGDLSFMPPLVMTIITQRPEIHFEYIGDFNYLPAHDDVGSDNMNLSI